MSILNLALDLATQGVPAFPCLADKRPACPQGFKNAATNPDAIRALWRRYPGPLIGVPTGAVSGFDVLDLDPRHSGDRWWQANAHRIHRTRMHRTRSDGLHVLFRHAEPVRNTQGKLAPGVDTRGEGGYVIWWPSHGCRVAEAPITPWPAWLLHRLLKRPETPKVQHPAGAALDPDERAQRIASRLLERLAGAAAGERHYALRKAAYTLGGLLHQLPFSGQEAQQRLLHAIQQAGAEDMANAAKTAAWGLERGRATPLTLKASP